MWTRRAALVATLPWARMNNLKPADQTARLRILGWAAAYVPDRDWFIQKAIAWWVRDLSKTRRALSRAFLMEHGPQMKPSPARKRRNTSAIDGNPAPSHCLLTNTPAGGRQPPDTVGQEPRITSSGSSSARSPRPDRPPATSAPARWRGAVPPQASARSEPAPCPWSPPSPARSAPTARIGGRAKRHDLPPQFPAAVGAARAASFSASDVVSNDATDWPDPIASSEVVSTGLAISVARSVASAGGGASDLRCNSAQPDRDSARTGTRSTRYIIIAHDDSRTPAGPQLPLSCLCRLPPAPTFQA